MPCHDLKLAFRQVLKNPGFTAVAMLTLALGIGTTSAVFSLIQGVLLTLPPYPEPERVILISSARTDGQPSPNTGMKTPNTKIQPPKKSQCPNPNPSSNVGALDLDLWSLSGVWSLVFGIWCFVLSPLTQHR